MAARLAARLAARRWPADRVADALWTGALALALFALAARGWPAAARVRELPPAAPPPPPAAVASSGDLVLASAVVRANVFAAGRTPPRVRWTPPPADTLPPGLAPDPAAAAALGIAARPSNDGAPRFYGTVIDSQGAAALLALGGTSAVARLYREGERAGRWRVLRVAPDRVLLATPAGERLTLRLPRGDASPDTVPPGR